MVLINAYHCRAGGGKQIAISFIKFLVQEKNSERYLFILNSVLFEELSSYGLLDERFRVIEGGMLEIRSKLKEIEKKNNPECVFSIFGPTLWRPKSTHIVGFAKAQIIYGDEYLNSGILSFIQKIKFKIKYAIQRYLFKNNSDIFIVESQDIREKLTKLFSLTPDQVFYVSNTYSQIFNEYIDRRAIFPEYPQETFNLFCLGNNYPHKNFNIIKSLLPLILEKKLNVKFFVTFSDADYEQTFKGFERFVENLGILNVEECIVAYKRSHALFLPTLLECFSASWPESMAMGIPILTSDRSFSKDICGEAAIYFDPLDSDDIVQKISDLIHDERSFNNLIENGKHRLTCFPTADERSVRYQQILNRVSK